MKANKFFSSLWFRCIVVLLVISCVAGGLLALLNDVLYVSANERSGRAIKKIYGKEMAYSILLDIDSDNDNINDKIEYENLGSINKIFTITNGESEDLLFQTTGIGGYKGTVTVWTQVRVNGDKYDIVKVVLESFTKETLMSKLSSSFYNNFCLTDVTADYNAGKNFTPYPDENGFTNVSSGATKSSNAGCNAVNCVLKYLRAGGQNG